MATRLIDSEMLESYRDLQSPEDPRFVQKFFTTFLKGIPPHLEALSQAITQSDGRKVFQSAHAIKSSCSNLGALPIIGICSELEQMGNSQSLAGAQERYLEVVRLCSELEKEVLALPEFAEAA